MKYFDKKVEFKEAERICKSNNATMISIHSVEENEFVRSYVANQSFYSPRVWIGLKRNISQGFRWVDKSPFNYSKWGTNQPDNSGDGEPYVEMLINEQGIWNDESDYGVSLRDSHGFVCQINYFNE
jgi:hypothetical protein